MLSRVTHSRRPTGAGPVTTGPIRNAMSVDVEDWFHIENFAGRIPRDTWDDYPTRVVENTDRLLDLFDEFGTRATFFVLGWVAERFPDLVRSIHRRGHEIGCHSYLHRLVYNLSPDEFRDDTARCKSLLEDLTGEPVLGYRAPTYSITDKNFWALDVLVELGFRYDSSVFPVHHDRYGVPDFDRWPVADFETPAGQHIHEFPMTTFRVGQVNLPAAGGGYLRMLPEAWSHHGIRAANRRNRPAIIYLHPWEVDPDVPRLSGLKPVTYVRSYLNLGRTYDRVSRLLSHYRWGTVAEVLGHAVGSGIS